MFEFDDWFRGMLKSTNSYNLTVVCFFQDFAKKLVKADRASLFLVDNASKELYARIFDTGASAHDANPCAKEIR